MDLIERMYTIIIRLPRRVGDGGVELSKQIAWLLDNIDNKWSHTPCWDTTYFEFEKEEDAMAFKLRWL